MSIKEQLAHAIEDLPESTTLEDAIRRIYLAFKLKQAMGQREEHGRLRFRDNLDRLAREGKIVIGQMEGAFSYPKTPCRAPEGLVERLLDEGRGE